MLRWDWTIAGLSWLTAIIALAVVLLTIAVGVMLGVRYPRLSLVTAVITIGAGVVGSAATKTLWSLLLAGALVSGVLVTLATARYRDDQALWPQILVRWLLFLGLLVGLMGAMLAIAGPAGVYVVLLFFALLVLVVDYALTARRSVAQDIVSTLRSCTAQHLPLAGALNMAVGIRKNKYGRTVRRIAHWLTQGYPLSQALAKGYPQCPAYVLALIGVAEKVDQTPQALKLIETEAVRQADWRHALTPVHPLYPLLLLGVSSSILLGVITFVIPKYQQVFRDFGGGLPRSTRILLHLSQAGYGWISVLFAGAVFLGIPAGLYVKFRPRRPHAPRLLSRCGDFVKWHLPMWHWFENHIGHIQVVSTLRLALHAGCPLNEAIAQTLALDVNAHLKKRLRHWLEQVERGEPPARAARASGLKPTLAWAFEGGQDLQSDATILDSLEDIYRNHYNYRAHLARFIFWPLMVLALGLMVGFVVYALFAPLTALIEDVAGSMGP